MYYVYVIIATDKQLYIGYTKDLKRRLAEHNAGQSKFTKGKKWTLVYYEAYKSERDARDRESKLKQRGQAVRFLKERIKNSISEIVTS